MNNILEKKLLLTKEKNGGNCMENRLRNRERLDVMEGVLFRKEVIVLPDQNIITVSFKGKDFDIVLYFPEIDFTLTVNSRDGEAVLSRPLTAKAIDSLGHYLMNCTIFLRDNGILDQIDLDCLWKE